MHRPLIALLVLCLAGIACGSTGIRAPDLHLEIDPVATQMAINTRVSERKTAAPTLTAEALRTPKPSATPTSTPRPDSNLNPTFVSPVPPAHLDSYQLVEQIAWDGVDDEGAEASGQVATTIEFVREPQAMQVSMDIDAEEITEAMGMLGLQGDSLEFYMREGSFYMGMFDGWMQMSLEALTMGLGFGELPLDGGEMDFSSTFTMTQTIRDATYVGQETRNGLATRHYTLNEDSFDPAALPAKMDVEAVSGDLYLAVDGDYLVSMDLTLEGANLAGPLQQGDIRIAEGTLTYRTDLSAINELRTIELPEEVIAATSPPEDIPILDDAKQLMGMTMFGASMFAFVTERQPDEVAEFYTGEMVELGWSEAVEEESEAMFSFMYTKGDRTMAVEIDADAMLRQTSVLLSSGEPSQFFPFPGSL